MRAFHTEFIYFCAMEVIHPSLNRIETDSLCNHVLTALAANVKWSFVPDFTASYSLPFDDFKRLVLSELALLGRNLIRIVVFRVVKVISPCGSKCAHIKYYN